MLQRQTFRSVQRIQWVRAMSALNQSAPQGNTKPQMTNKPVNNNTTSTELQDNLMTSAPLWNENVATESEIDVKADYEPVRTVQELERRTVRWLKEHGNTSESKT